MDLEATRAPPACAFLAATLEKTTIQFLATQRTPAPPARPNTSAEGTWTSADLGTTRPGSPECHFRAAFVLLADSFPSRVCPSSDNTLDPPLSLDSPSRPVALLLLVGNDDIAFDFVVGSNRLPLPIAPSEPPARPRDRQPDRFGLEPLLPKRALCDPPRRTTRHPASSPAVVRSSIRGNL